MNQSRREVTLNEFLKAYVADRSRGEVHDLEYYLERFPGQSEVVAREFVSLEQASEDDAASQIDRIGDYQLVRELGRGGQGIVYLAEDARLNRRVALKVLRPGAGLSGSTLARFRREAEVTARLDHPNVCTIFDTGTHDGCAFIAMQFIDGEPLTRRFVSAGPLARDRVDEALELVEQAARGLHAAHEMGIVHRDIKPANILVTAENKPVVVDFGLASVEDDDLPLLTGTGDLLGTPAYMSPEQIAQESTRVDRRTDVYSLGITLFECLTAQRPFEAPTREGTYHAILSEPMPRLARLNPAVSSDLEVVLETAMEKDAGRRYQTALAFAEDLGRVRRREPIAARPIGSLVRLARWRQRNPGLAVAIVAVFLTAALTIVGVVIRNRELQELRTAAVRSAEDANDQRVRAEGALAELTRLSDDRRVRKLRERAERLWPAHPAQIEALQQWLEDAEALLRGYQEHEGSLANLQRESAAHETEDLLWRIEILDRLVREMGELRRDEIGLVARIRKRLAFARSVEQRSIGDHPSRWRQVEQAIATSPAYRDVALVPQIGLIPLGQDPESGMLEFLHLATHSGPIPDRDEQGRIPRSEGLGIVLVLLPGGVDAVGSDGGLLEGTNLDPRASVLEMPAIEIRLDPFFLSKYEVNQAQWARFTGSNPSWYRVGKRMNGVPITAMHPVTNVNWHTACGSLWQMGLTVPTEVQWEYAYRAGSDTPYPFAPSRVAEFANLADSTFSSTFESEEFDPELLDGFSVHAPIGSFAANPFGLHDLAGNVYEWCLDGVGPYSKFKPRDGDGYHEGEKPRILRGGSFKKLRTWARSSARAFNAPSVATSEVGFRAARALEVK